MGPALLLCPSSSAAHLWSYASPLKKTRQKDGTISLSHGYFRCSANAHCTRDFKRRPTFFFHPASSSSEECRKLSYPFAWRRVSAASSSGEVSIEEVAVASSEAPTELSKSSEPPFTSKGEAPVATEEAPVTTEEAPVGTERRTQARRTLNRSNSNANKAAVVTPAELLPGAVFPGKVTSIPAFGAFVDFGAFTNGLVHISRLSKSYVKKVEDVVQIGQDVKVQVLEVDLQANRISLMLVQEGKEEAPQEGEAGEKRPPRSPQQQARTPRREATKRAPSQRQAVTTTMKKGETAAGTVKNMIKSGVFVTLPDGTDGYLPASEVVFKGPNTSLEAQFQIGQELTVRVLRIEKGRVNLTMRREVNFDKLNEDLNKGVVDGATNAFEIAFRRNELIASFLSDREKQKAQADMKKEAVGSVEEVKDVAEVEKPAVEREGERVANGVNLTEDEAISSEAVNSVELKDVPEGKKLAVEEEEEKLANGVDTSSDKAVSTDAANLDEDAKDVAQVEKLAGETEEETVANDVSSEAASFFEDVKDVAVEEKLAVEKEEETVANGVDATKDEAVSSEAVNFVEEVKDIDEVEKPAVEKEEKTVVTGVDASKDEDVLSEAVNSVEEVKDLAGVKKPAVENVEEIVENGINPTKDEALSSEAVNSIEEVNVTGEVEKPDVEKEEEKVAKGPSKDETVSSEVVISA